MGRDLFKQDAGRDLLGSGTAPIVSASKSVRARRDIESLLKPEPDEFQKIARETGPVEAGFASMGRGLFKIGRALGLAEPASEAEQKGFAALEEERPISTAVGEAVGGALPFAAVPVGAIPSTAWKTAAGATLGAIEGGLIRRGEGETETEQIKGAGIGGIIGGGAEAFLPVAGRIGGKLIRRFLGRNPKSAILTTEGLPTEELLEAMEKAGLSFDDLKDTAIDLIGGVERGAVPDQKLRAALFEELKIPATKGDITQDFAQQATEARLFEAAADPFGDPIRSLRLQQSQGLTGNLDSLIEKSGVPENLGSSLKEALSGRKSFLRNQKNALYKAAIKSADEVEQLPFPTIGIENAIPDQRTVSRLTRIQGSQADAALDLIAEFGIDKSEKAIKRLEAKNIEPIELSLQNFEDFRAALNQIERADTTGASSVIIGPIREALDSEADNIVNVLLDAGVTDKKIIDKFKAARKITRQLKTEFSPESITGRLINTKRDGVTPVIEASKVFDNIVGTNKPTELLERTITSLKKSGPKGVQAIGDLQAATVLDLIESAYKAETRKVQGVKTFGGVPFNKRINQIGDEKLNLIFSTNKNLLKEIKKVAAAASAITPPSGAVPKGSASVILDTLNKAGIMSILGKIPGGGLFAEGVTRLAEGQANRAALRQALDARPELKKTVGLIQTELPSLMVAFGLTGLDKEDTQQ